MHTLHFPQDTHLGWRKQNKVKLQHCESVAIQSLKFEMKWLGIQYNCK